MAMLARYCADSELWLLDLSLTVCACFQQSLEMMTMLKLFPHDVNKEKGSMYAVAMNAGGSLVAAGSSDDITRIFDVRSGQKVMKLKVRVSQHNVLGRGVCVDGDTTLCA